MANGKPGRPAKYTEEYKRNAVDYYLQSGKSQRECASDLGIPHKTLSRWVQGVHPRASRRTTVPDPSAASRPDLIGRDAASPVPTVRLVGDITYLRTGQGWLYMAVVIDLCTRMAVGLAFSERMTADLPIAALEFLQGLSPVDGSQWQSSFTAASVTGHDGDSTDPGNRGSFTRSKERVRDIFGAAPGMNSQMSCGVFCGWDDTDGFTGVPGLYVAGNGIYGCMVNGAVFAVQTNHPGCCVMGNHAGAAAADYAASTEMESLDQAQVDAIIEEIFAPSTRAKGVDPNWVIERLRDILVAPGVHVVKNEKALQAALMQIEILRDDFVPMMMGYTGHDLRLCLEAKHKCRSAEMKVKANLFRTESRGLHYRSDYPFRNDEEWLCHVGVSLDENGEVVCRKIDIPDSWKGDTSKKHEERYLVLFPGEAEALGIEVEESGR